MRCMLSRFLGALLACMVAVAARAQSTPIAPVSTALDGLEVIASVSRDALEVGETLDIRLLFSGDAASSARLAFPESASDQATMKLGEWDVLAVKPVFDAKGVRVGVELQVSTFDVSTPLKSIPLTWGTTTPMEGNANLPPVTVQSLVGEEADPASFRDIAGAMDVGAARFSNTALVVSIVVAILAAIAALAFFLRRKPVKIELPHERALRELELLAREGLAIPGGCHTFYIALTDTVRSYVSARFVIGATRQTTREFTTHARASGSFNDAQVDRLTALLRLADYVKFAGAQTDSTRAREDVAAARAFVAETMPRAATAETQERAR